MSDGFNQEPIGLVGLPDYTDARVNLALRYEEQKKMDEAIAMLQSALKINPLYGIALYNLGRVYFNQALLLQRQRKNTEALAANENAARYYRLSLKERPRHASSMIGLGESLRRLKKFEEAEPYLQGFANTTPKMPMPCGRWEMSSSVSGSRPRRKSGSANPWR